MKLEKRQQKKSYISYLKQNLVEEQKWSMNDSPSFSPEPDQPVKYHAPVKPRHYQPPPAKLHPPQPKVHQSRVAFGYEMEIMPPTQPLGQHTIFQEKNEQDLPTWCREPQEDVTSNTARGGSKLKRNQGGLRAPKVARSKLRKQEPVVSTVKERNNQHETTLESQKPTSATRIVEETREEEEIYEEDFDLHDSLDEDENNQQVDERPLTDADDDIHEEIGSWTLKLDHVPGKTFDSLDLSVSMSQNTNLLGQNEPPVQDVPVTSRLRRPTVQRRAKCKKSSKDLMKPTFIRLAPEPTSMAMKSISMPVLEQPQVSVLKEETNVPVLMLTAEPKIDDLQVKKKKRKKRILMKKKERSKTQLSMEEDQLLASLARLDTRLMGMDHRKHFREPHPPKAKASTHPPSEEPPQSSTKTKLFLRQQKLAASKKSKKTNSREETTQPRPEFTHSGPSVRKTLTEERLALKEERLALQQERLASQEQQQQLSSITETLEHPISNKMKLKKPHTRYRKLSLTHSSRIRTGGALQPSMAKEEKVKVYPQAQFFLEQ